MEEKFKSILKENEKVVFVTNATFGSVYSSAIGWGILALIFFGMFLGFLPLEISEGNLNNLLALWIILPLVLTAVTVLLIILIGKKFLKNYYVCLTNERVIIRKGLFTVNFDKYSISKVSGNIEVNTKQLLFDRKNETSCRVFATIELLPVGHGKIYISTESLNNGLKFSELLEKTVKENAKKQKNVKE